MAGPRKIHLERLRARGRAIERPAGTSEVLLRRQSRRPRELVRYAGRFSPHYRGWFHGLGLSAPDIRTVGDLPRLPVIEKRAARNQIHPMVLLEHVERLKAQGLDIRALVEDAE